MRDKEQGEGAADNADLSLRLELICYLYLFFFSSASLVEPGRFGSVQSVSDFEK